MRDALKRFIRDEHGLEMVEFAIIVGIVTAGTLGAMTAIGVWLSNRYVTLQNDLGA